MRCGCYEEELTDEDPVYCAEDFKLAVKQEDLLHEATKVLEWVYETAITSVLAHNGIDGAGAPSSAIPLALAKEMANRTRKWSRSRGPR